MSRARVGLTLGKFAPLHRGHQHLIETALAEVDHLVVAIYDAPDVTDVPLEVRAAWLRELYPSIEVIEVRNGPTEVGDSPEIRRRHEQHLLALLDGRRITHFYSSEFYGEHVSAALGAVDRRVDPARSRFPVSGSAVRADPYGQRQWIHPRVYRDLIVNVVLLGAPCTGKTTLARALAEEYGTVWMPEYGREYWERHQVNRRLTPHQLVEIAEGHLERENALLLEANRCLFTDTNALTTRLFALAYHGSADPRLKELAALAERRYDLIVVCDTDIPYVDTWDRSGEADRATFQQRVLEDLRGRGLSYITVRGSVAERVAQVRAALTGFRKFDGSRGRTPPAVANPSHDES